MLDSMSLSKMVMDGFYPQLAVGVAALGVGGY